MVFASLTDLVKASLLTPKLKFWPCFQNNAFCVNSMTFALNKPAICLAHQLCLFGVI